MALTDRITIDKGHENTVCPYPNHAEGDTVFFRRLRKILPIDLQRKTLNIFGRPLITIFVSEKFFRHVQEEGDPDDILSTEHEDWALWLGWTTKTMEPPKMV